MHRLDFLHASCVGPACLRACLGPACLGPACLPALVLPACLPWSCLPACLPWSCLPACLPALGLPACIVPASVLPACLGPACLPAILSVPACLQVASIVLDSMKEVNIAKPGENVRIKFSKLSSEQAINKGFVLCAQGRPLCPDVNSFIADIQVMQLLDHKLLMTSGYTCLLHVHTIATDCTIDRLLIQTDLATKKKTREPQFVKSNSFVTVKIDVPQSVSVETFERMAVLGQFTLRDEGRTIALGRITRLLIKKKK